jgi:polyvinyl alcohol dehydrogenase (cytochrome)
MSLLRALIASLALVVSTVPAEAQAPAAAPAPTPRQLFDQACLTCHGNSSVPRAADPSVLRRMTPERIYEALTTGVMRAQAQNLSDPARRGIAEYLGDRKLGAGAVGDAGAMPNRCVAGQALGDVTSMPAWNGWSPGTGNTRFQPSSAAGLSAAQVPRLRLAWAFGLPGATAVYGQPTVAGGRVFVGADSGYVYAVDQASGCVHWSFQAQAGVRSAVTVGTASNRPAAFFGDLKGNVYALDAATGQLFWRVSVDDHQLARVTASPVWYRGRVYVSVSSFEEGASTSARYPCCTFRGSVVALGADTGAFVWKSYTIPEVSKPTRTNAAGTQQYGPSGGSVWSSPTIDARRGVLYIGTGNAYSRPAAPTTDALMALALDTGTVRWSVQALAEDAWIPGCAPGGAPAGNCPEKIGPDYDFGASPMLVTLAGGRELIVTIQKSGDAWAHDPDRQGAVVWRSTLARTPPTPDGELVWGAAADESKVFVGLTSGGVAAHALDTGMAAWTTGLTAAAGRRDGTSGAVSAIPGVVFSGGWDGMLRALAADTGAALWEYDTQRDFETVNRVAARGGSMGAPGPTVAGGMLFVGSGYIGVRNGTPGNVLLAFRAN